MRDWLDEGVDPDEYEEPTLEELQAQAEMIQDWQVFEAAWEASGGKCRCGGDVSLQDAWHFGCCDECRYDNTAF